MWFLLISIISMAAFICGCYYCAVWVDAKEKILTKQQILERNYLEYMEIIYH